VRLGRDWGKSFVFSFCFLDTAELTIIEFVPLHPLISFLGRSFFFLFSFRAAACRFF